LVALSATAASCNSPYSHSQLMSLFSQRQGLKPLQNPLQLRKVDLPLRNVLWSALNDIYLRHISEDDGSPVYPTLTVRAKNVRALFVEIWCEYFKHPSDTVPRNLGIDEIRQYFFERAWNELFDLLEFVAKESAQNSAEFTKLCNFRLEQENSAYRFVGKEILEITSKAEVEEIQLAASSGIHGVEKHIATALGLLADRKNPDYRNCIKEAISAVETVCRSFAGGSTLSDALKTLKRRVEIHPAFERSLNALYGYTSDQDGIRHSLLEEKNISFSDAKFMLVTCSAFVNYLIGKAAESGIKLKT
jgi:hypothetical protein